LDTLRHQISNTIYQWLVLPDNLTETIKKTGVDFSLTVESQSMGNPYLDEIDAFKDCAVDASHSLIRKICLKGNHQPLVFARVIIPSATYLNYKNDFDTLGDAPIGNTLLYTNKRVIRGAFEYKSVEHNDPVFQELQRLDTLINGDTYWARRSIFILPKGALLISEFILTNIPNYPE
jgi:chorismate-pyruvate lyase